MPLLHTCCSARVQQQLLPAAPPVHCDVQLLLVCRLPLLLWAARACRTQPAELLLDSLLLAWGLPQLLLNPLLLAASPHQGLLQQPAPHRPLLLLMWAAASAAAAPASCSLQVL